MLGIKEKTVIYEEKQEKLKKIKRGLGNMKKGNEI